MGSTVLWPTAEGGKRAPKLSWPSTRHELTLDLIAAAITLRLESPPSNHLQAAPVSPQPLQWGPWAEVGKDSSTCTGEELRSHSSSPSTPPSHCPTGLLFH
ncbi:hypothetical protein SAY86_015578 [Trapa natans]|uniref:Uncharacterized protein n=1 Tax=Trapa natans TaxID=22666 RepID=A0AAN7LIS5_TRANT|nr:hypothetical protein SAY86_015578 [Trapa natans]